MGFCLRRGVAVRRSPGGPEDHPSRDVSKPSANRSNRCHHLHVPYEWHLLSRPDWAGDFALWLSAAQSPQIGVRFRAQSAYSDWFVPPLDPLGKSEALESDQLKRKPNALFALTVGFSRDHKFKLHI